MTSCSNDDNIAETPADIPGTEAGIPFSATISIDGKGQTRAYTSVSLDGYIDVQWRSGEQVALLYKTGTTPRTTIATVTSVSEGKATISATLNKNVTNGTAVTLLYPYWSSMFDAMSGDFNPDFFGLQSGSLTGDGSSGDNSISNHFDLRQGTGTIYYNGTDAASLSSDVTMESQIAVWKLTLKDASNNSLQASTLEVDYKGVRAFATPGYDKSEFYMAVPAEAAGESSDLYIIATKSNGDKYLYSKSGITLTASTYYQSAVKLSKVTVNRNISSSDTDVMLADGDVVKGSGGSATHIIIADGATVTLDGLYNTNNDSYHGIECLGDANIILLGSNSVKGTNWRAGIYVPEGKTLTVSGCGFLTAKGGDQAAGIGGGYNISCGNIIINGGRITAIGGANAAGIGGGSPSKFGSISIGANIASVIATHGYGAWLPIGIGASDQGSGSVTVDGVTPWSGSATEHLNFASSTVKDAGNHDVTRWTLTRK